MPPGATVLVDECRRAVGRSRPVPPERGAPMTESNATGVDPRYDPRYQRGYAGGAEADAPASPSRSSRPLQRLQPPTPQRDSLQERERRASERTARPIAPEYQEFAPEGRAVTSSASPTGTSAVPTT